MKKKTSVFVWTVVALLAIAGLGLLIKHGMSARALEEDSLSSYVTNRIAVFAPQGTDVTNIVRNLELEKEHSEEFKKLFPNTQPKKFEQWLEVDKKRSEEASYVSDAIKEFLMYEGNGSSGDNCSFYPDYFGGVYIMRSPEYQTNEPHELDGTEDSYKYCVLLVKGMEEEAADFVKFAGGFGDTIVYKYVEHSFNEMSEYANNVILPKLEAAGIESTSVGVGVKNNVINYCVFKDDYERACPIIQALAEESGYTIVVNASERWTFE